MFRLVNITALKSLLLAGIVLTGCQFSKSKVTQVIVIMVENLGVQQIDCGHNESGIDPSVHSGIRLMCSESIRFTHAFTTSPLSVPAMTSIFTAQYPLEHGLRHHGLSYLSSQAETLAEKAQTVGYSTAFISGGAPAIRKYNINQGFDMFDDNITLSQNSFFRSFQQSIDVFMEWHQDIGHRPSLTFFYVPDLLFPETPTQTSLGESRDLTFESQLAEFDETFYNLINHLKKNQTWDQTLVVVVGLNGPAQYPRPGELDNTSLFSDRTQVGLLIKPAQKPRDEGINWTFDQNISLADLGKTLFDLVDVPAPDSKLKDFPVFSVKQALENIRLELPAHPLLLETAWAEWQEKVGIRYATIWDQFLFIFDDHMQIFNSLIDRFELSPMKVGEPGIRELLGEVLKLQAKNQFKPWPGLSRDTELKWQSLSERLAHRLKNDPSIVQRYSQDLLKQQKWPELLKWAEGMKFKDYQIIAQLNLIASTASTKEISHLQEKFSEPCLRKDIRKCDDNLAVNLLRWAQDPKNEVAQRRFQRMYQQMKVDQSLSQKNWRLQGIWDISQETEKDLEITLMLLSLPEMKAFR